MKQYNMAKFIQLAKTVHPNKNEGVLKIEKDSSGQRNIQFF
jgi:hypothetical protein